MLNRPGAFDARNQVWDAKEAVGEFMQSDALSEAGARPPAQLTSVALGTVVLLATLVALISARTVPFLLLAMLLALLASAVARRTIFDIWPGWSNLTIALALFVGFAGLSALWAEEPAYPLTKFAFAALMAAAALALPRLIDREAPHHAFRLNEGVWMGLLIGLGYFLTEMLTDQAIKINVYNALGLAPPDLKPARHFTLNPDGTILRISDTDMTRNTAPISVFVWPAMMAGLAGLAAPWNRAVAGLILLLGVTCALMSPHETSKVAILLGLIAFALGRWAAPWAYQLMAVAWAGCCLLVVPLALWAHDLDLHNAPQLQMSAQHRIIIWNHTAERTLESPIFGIGANMTYVVGPRMRGTFKNEKGEQWERTLSRHAHNVFLQTWFELGAIGALLLLGAGLVVLRTIAGLEAMVRPYAFAMFASASMLMAASYGMWQLWFMATFAASVILFAIARRAMRDDRLCVLAN